MGARMTRSFWSPSASLLVRLRRICRPEEASSGWPLHFLRENAKKRSLDAGHESRLRLMRFSFLVLRGWSGSRQSLRPGSRLTDPAVMSELLTEFGAEWSCVTAGHVRFDISQRAHTGNDGADGRFRQCEPQCHLGHRHPRGNHGPQCLGSFNARIQIFGYKIGAPPILFGPS